MRIFIFDRLDSVSRNYHKSGGLVILATDKEEAKNLVSVDENIIITDEDWSKVEEFEVSSNYPKRHWVFPDAGCC